MISFVYIIIYSLFGFYLYYSRNDDKKRPFYMDVFHGFSGYKSTWEDLSNIFNTEWKEWDDLTKCGAESNWGWAGIMKYFFGKIFTWFWVAVTILASGYAATHFKLEEMKIIGTILAVLIGSFFITLAAMWDNITSFQDAIQNTLAGGFIGWLFARQWGAVLGVVVMIIYTMVMIYVKKNTDGDDEKAETDADSSEGVASSENNPSENITQVNNPLVNNPYETITQVNNPYATATTSDKPLVNEASAATVNDISETTVNDKSATTVNDISATATPELVSSIK